MTTQTAAIESPIERKFYEALTPHLKLETVVTPQLEVQTRRRTRRIDFLLSDGKTIVVVECDGAAYHNFDDDLRRDVELFGVGAHAIFHFSGSFIHHHAGQLAPLLAYFVPDFFVKKVDLTGYCPLPVDGAYVRLSPTFPGMRPELAGRVIDGWSMAILSTCHTLQMNLRNEVLGRLQLRKHGEESGADYSPGAQKCSILPPLKPIP